MRELFYGQPVIGTLNYNSIVQYNSRYNSIVYNIMYGIIYFNFFPQFKLYASYYLLLESLPPLHYQCLRLQPTVISSLVSTIHP